MQDYWEFPGGKINPGESSAAALARELKEELAIGVTAFEHFLALQHDYPDLLVAIDFYLVSAWSGEPAGAEGQALRWVALEDLGESRLLPADRPLIAALQRELPAICDRQE